MKDTRFNGLLLAIVVAVSVSTGCAINRPDQRSALDTLEDAKQTLENTQSETASETDESDLADESDVVSKRRRPAVSAPRPSMPSPRMPSVSVPRLPTR